MTGGLFIHKIKPFVGILCAIFFKLNTLEPILYFASTLFKQDIDALKAGVTQDTSTSGLDSNLPLADQSKHLHVVLDSLPKPSKPEVVVGKVKKAAPRCHAPPRTALEDVVERIVEQTVDLHCEVSSMRLKELFALLALDAEHGDALEAVGKK